MDQDEFYIRSNGMPGDISPWIAEKTRHMLKGFALLTDALRQESDLRPAFREASNRHIEDAAHQGLRVLAFASGNLQAHSPADWSRIARLGVVGYEELRIRYHGDPPADYFDTRDVGVFHRRLGDVMMSNNASTQRRIVELLRRCTIRYWLAREAIALAESYLRGEFSWSELRQRVLALLEEAP